VRRGPVRRWVPSGRMWMVSAVRVEVLRNGGSRAAQRERQRKDTGGGAEAHAQSLVQGATNDRSLARPRLDAPHGEFTLRLASR
jgi:hypothetical protein